MNSSSFVHYVRDQVIFISMTTIATILLFTLGLMAAASLEGKAQTAGIVGAVVIGLWLLVASLGTIRRLQLLSESIPEEEQTLPLRVTSRRTRGQCVLRSCHHRAGRCRVRTDLRLHRVTPTARLASGIQSPRGWIRAAGYARLHMSAGHAVIPTRNRRDGLITGRVGNRRWCRRRVRRAGGASSLLARRIPARWTRSSSRCSTSALCRGHGGCWLGVHQVRPAAWECEPHRAVRNTSRSVGSTGSPTRASGSVTLPRAGVVARIATTGDHHAGERSSTPRCRGR